MKKSASRWFVVAGLWVGLVAAGCGNGPGNFQPGNVLDGALGDGAPAADGDAGRDVSFGGLLDTGGSDSGPDTAPADDADSTRPDFAQRDTGGLCASPVDDACGTEEICGDGEDNNCDGRVDEGCPCTPGQVQRCFPGPPGRRGIGACTDGQQFCTRAGKTGVWGECMGAIVPSGTEACDGLDNDCNGCVDDDPACVKAVLNCPSPDDPRLTTAPLMYYPLNGSDFYTGEATAWRWEVSCPASPCAAFGAGQTSCPQPEDANAMNTRVFLTLSGDYTVKLTVTTSTGEEVGCTFVVHARGPGLRVELCWDTTGETDVDLHLHRPRSTKPWFDLDDTCFYRNCKASASDPPDWGYPTTPIENCENGPEGAQWRGEGSCRNPRLDIDNIFSENVPENINVDNPADGDVFRIGVNYYGDGLLFGGVTHPIVNVYCGGALRASYGVAPDQVNFRNAGAEQGDFWRVADVRTIALGGGNTDCEVTALHPPGQSSGYWITTGGDLSY